MYSDEELASAVKAGVLSESQVAALRAHVAQLRATPDVDEEHFRLVTGFNDIFVVVACVLLLASIAWIGREVAPWLGPLGVAAAAWGLAEFFVRKRHMALPAIVLLLAFVGGTVMTGVAIVGRAEGPIGLVGAVSALAAWLHWRRFHVPITVAAGTAAVVAAAAGSLLWLVPAARGGLAAISLLAGIGVFLLAMRWDRQDLQRRTGKSDVAFWLHLLAAPLLVHPVFAVVGHGDGQMSVLQIVLVFVLYPAIAMVSLAIDRRALMASALAYVLYAFSDFLKEYGVVSLSFAFTALIIGSALLLLSAFWHRSRGAVLRRLPDSVRALVPPLR